MSIPARRSTVHDLAALRLHPSGERVRPSAARKPQAARTANGQWIARDAGGRGAVKTRVTKKRQRKAVGTDEEEEFDLRVDEGGDGVGDEKQDEGEGEELRDPRAKKRRRFAEDDSFIQGSSTTAVPPSSDLLKHIHYFSSTYYASQSQLSAAAREAKRERRARAKARQAARDAAGAQSEEDDGSNDAGEEEYNEDDEDEERVKGKGKARAKETDNVRRGGRRKGAPRTLVTDMYKSLDGSALLVLGMLMEEYVKGAVRAGRGWAVEDDNGDDEVDGEGEMDNVAIESRDEHDEHDEHESNPEDEGNSASSRGENVNDDSSESDSDESGTPSNGDSR